MVVSVSESEPPATPPRRNTFRRKRSLREKVKQPRPQVWIFEFIAYVFLHIVGLFFIVLNRFRFINYEPEEKAWVASCMTNGMGHVQQLCRVLRVCRDRGFPAPKAIILSRRDKVPDFIMAKFQELAPNAEIVDCGFEVAYDSERGTEISNVGVFLEVCRGLFLGPAVMVIHYIYSALQKHRPCFILSCFDPYVGMVNYSLMGPAKIICCASQGSIVTQGREEGGHKEAKGLFMVMLIKACLGPGNAQGLVPFTPFEMEDAVPQIVDVPPPVPEEDLEDYYVAYSAFPAVFKRFKTHEPKYPIHMYTRDHEYWVEFFSGCSHVTVHPRSNEFILRLAKSRGLFSSASRGVVSQAVAMGKPVFLLNPSNHIEQNFNARAYQRHFVGVVSDESMTIEDWESTDWDLQKQSEMMRAWLGQTDDKIEELIIRPGLRI